MISLQTIMLVALGFLVAALLALMIAPAFWSRAVRLTTRRITETLPITELEIRADKDRLRAEYAMTVHRLETRIEQTELKRARYLIDLNRRDATITELENTLTTARADLEEHENARRVLEHTVSDQLPKLDQRLAEARNLIEERDTELATLAAMTQEQVSALNEATAINAQQAAELERLTTSLAVVGARTSNSLQDGRTDAEVALKSEIDALRAKTREQAAMIARLQTVAQSAPAPSERKSQTPRVAGVALVTSPVDGDAEREKIERELRATQAQVTEKATELAKAKAELAALRASEPADSNQSVLGLKARLTGLEVERDEYLAQITKLRTETASLSEQLTRQSADFAEFMRRSGSGSQPASTASQTNDGLPQPSRLSLAERVAQTRNSSNAHNPSAQVHILSAAPARSSGRADDAATPEGATTPAATSEEPPTDTPNSPRGRLIDRISSVTKG